MAGRLSGSSDLYGDGGRDPQSGINFVTAHDGFTLHDLVSYNEKHNEANGEENRDGAEDNLSWNCGVEGPTDDPKILALREQQKRNFMAMLLFSQGVPMICGGDELGRTQGGNNNAYCQDNEVSWFDWDLDERRQAMIEFTRRLIGIRQAHPTLRRGAFFSGKLQVATGIKDVTWLRQDGNELSDEEWNVAWMRCFGMRISGIVDEVDELGQAVRDDTLLLLLNADQAQQGFILPATEGGGPWDVLVDTSRPAAARHTYKVGSQFRIHGRSLVLLRSPLSPPARRARS
jgi:glycogen operon protein